MRQTLANYSQKTIEVLFYILFFFTPFIFFSFQLKTNTSELFEINKMFFVYALTTMIVGAWLTKIILVNQILFKRTLLFLPFLLFLLSQILSTFFSIDPHTSIWGYYSRGNGGLLSTITYLALYFAYVSNMNSGQTKQCIKFLLGTATILSLWGISEHFGASPSCVLIRGNLADFNDSCWVQDVQNRVFATLGQPNWLAAWIVAIAPLAWAGLNNKLNVTHSTYSGQAGNKLFKFDTKTVLYIALTGATLLATIYTKSRSGFLGLVTAFLIFWLLNIFKTRKIKSLFLVTCYMLLIALFVGTPYSPSLAQLLSPKTSSQPTTNNIPQAGTSLENGGTESGDIRKIVWTGAINIWRAYPIFGSGIETFAYSYYNFRPVEHNNTSEWELLYNKAHNEYLNYLANTGAFGLLTYLGIIGAFAFYIFKQIKNQRSKIKMTDQNIEICILHFALISGFASILVTNFFGFSVVAVQLLFFLYPAMAFALTAQQQTTNNKQHSKFTWKQIITLSFVLCSMFYVLFRIFQIWTADILYTSSQSLNGQGLEGQAFIKIREALSLRSDEPNYYDQLARVTSNLAVVENDSGNATKSADYISLARDSSNVATSISPYNLNLLKSQAIIYQKFALIDPTKLKDVTIPLEKAIKLAPTDPKIRYNLGQVYARLGRIQDAEKIFVEAVNLKPNYYDARVGLATIYTKLGLKEKAREQYQWILENLNPNDQEVRDSLQKLQSSKLR